jgi:hypothetical protein
MLHTLDLHECFRMPFLKVSFYKRVSFATQTRTPIHSFFSRVWQALLTSCVCARAERGVAFNLRPWHLPPPPARDLSFANGPSQPARRASILPRVLYTCAPEPPRLRSHRAAYARSSCLKRLAVYAPITSLRPL